MRQIFNISISGRMNRVDLPNKVKDGEVLVRENFEPIGQGEEKRNRKVSGASRFSDNTLGTSYTWGTRYYSSGAHRKTFAFNSGKLYHVDDNGNETELLSIFSPTAIPCSEIMRISSNDVLLWSEGVSTGMYSHDGNIANTFNKEAAVTVNFVGILGHLDRLFGFEENSEDLYFSKNLEPTNFTDSTDAGIITIGPRRGSKIVGIALLNETIFIFKQDSIWRLIGRTPSEFEVREVHPYLGCSARRSIRNTDKGIVLLGSDFEFYFFGGSIDSTIMITNKVLMGGDLTRNLVPILNRDKVETAVATYHNHTYRCSFTENLKTSNNMEYCFNTLNETDYFTRDFNISCYIPWDRTPDKHELLFGRADLGRLMKMHIGLNVDNDAGSPKMHFRLQTKFQGPSEPRNARYKRAFFNVGVLGAEPIKCFYHLDCRTARSDAGNDQWKTRGETKELSPTVLISSQRAITSRVNLKYGKSKGQNISFEIDHEGCDVDFELSSIDVEAIVKTTTKKSEKVAA